MQSLENKIKTELIMTAMRIAEEALKGHGHTIQGPYSVLGLLERALVLRAKEISLQTQV